MNIDVGYIGEEVVEVDCVPSHSLPHVITIIDHPIHSYSGKYCRMDDWDNNPHFETGDGFHFYYQPYPDWGIYAWNFDDRDQDGTLIYSNGGFYATYTEDTYEDLALIAEAN